MCSFFKTLVNHEVTIELKNDISIRGTLKSVDQYLNIKLDDISVVEELKYPHLVSWIFSIEEGKRRVQRARFLGHCERRCKVSGCVEHGVEEQSTGAMPLGKALTDHVGMRADMGYRARSRMSSFAAAWYAMCTSRLRL